MQCQGQELVCSPDAITIPENDNWRGVGSGWGSYADKLQAQLMQKINSYQAIRYPQANAMIPLALAAFAKNQVVAAEQALPIYLRNKVV
jgi:tRNA threonylcarbamoyladenosine biosynthesis protein TsaB